MGPTVITLEPGVLVMSVRLPVPVMGPKEMLVAAVMGAGALNQQRTIEFWMPAAPSIMFRPTMLTLPEVLVMSCAMVVVPLTFSVIFPPAVIPVTAGLPAVPTLVSRGVSWVSSLWPN